MKKLVVFMLSVFLLVCCAIGFMACAGGGNDSGDIDKPSTEEPNNPNEGDDEGGGNEPVTPDKPKEELAPSDIYKKVNPSVAFILIDNLRGLASGTGFFIDDEGTLVTNYHVIEDGTAGAIQLSDGTQAAIGNVLGYDEDLDIAVLETTATNTTPVEIGNSSLVEVGDTVYAIGYPAADTIGFSSSTFTTGMVSMHRSIEGYTYIQSTVDITHGNSGGTLINTYGEVIGITTAGLNVGDVDYMNLSIPIQRVDTVALDDNESLLIVTKRHYPVYARFYNGSNLFTTQTLKYEQTASNPSSSPSKTGYTFTGWYADSGLTKPFDFSTKILEDTRIYAKFDINNYSVTYNLNSGKWNGATPDNTWTINDCGTTLPTPVRSGYLFDGWTDSYGNFVDKLPTSSNLGNVAYSARWIEGAEGLVINNGTVTDYNGTATSVKVPDSYRNTPVTKIGNSAFSGATSLQSITLSESITSIESNTFTGSNIKEVYAPSACAGTVAKQTGASTVVVTSGDTIGESAFSGCTYLTSITLPNELTAIGDSAFYGCTGLESITIPNGVTVIGTSAFSGCAGLENVTLPNGLTTIKDSAFKGCTGLESIIIPNSVISVGSSSFTGCDNLITISMPSTCALTIIKQLDVADITITGDTIFNNVFQNYTGTLNITLADSITTIGDYAFSGCSGLTEIILPNNLQNIGDYAFEKCVNLTEIILPNSITKIGSYAFCDCVGLTSISIPDQLTYISQDTFTNCTNIGEVHAPASCAGSLAKATGASKVIITSGSTIGLRAFEDCIDLKEVIISDSVTSIEHGAFWGCSGLTYVSLSKSIKTINSYAFDDCSNLEEIIIPESVKSIYEGAFSSCDKLTIYAETEEKPDGWDDGWNYECPVVWDYGGQHGITSDGFCWASTKNNGITISSYKNTDVDLVIPSMIEGNVVNCIGENAFYRNTLITNVVIPNTIISIGDSAFYNCSNLASIIIEEKSCLKSIGHLSFSYCQSLTVYIKDKEEPLWVESFWSMYKRPIICDYGNEHGITQDGFQWSLNKNDEMAIYGYQGNASNIEIPSVINGYIVKKINNRTFNNCAQAISILIPKTIEIIEESAFRGFENLESIKVDEGNVVYKSEGNCLIERKTSKLVLGCNGSKIPAYITSIGDYAFYNCTKLTNLVLPDSVEFIGNYAFYNCEALTGLEMPNNLIHIGEYAFYECNFTQLVLPDNLISIGAHAFHACHELKTLTFPDRVTSIGDYAFYNCNSLIDLIFPNSITEIGNYAFTACHSLVSVFIPSSVTHIGEGAFTVCFNLTIYTEFLSKPTGWNVASYSCPVVWGYKGD